MEYSFAPMEGITGAIFRRIHHRYFPGVDRYKLKAPSATKLAWWMKAILNRKQKAVLASVYV